MSSIIGPVWSKRARLEGQLDPLGLDRASDRLTSELIPGVTVNVNLARYFSFFPWLFSNLRASDEDGQYQEIIRAEKAYVLGASLAHNGAACATGIAGRDLIGDSWNVKQSCNLDRLKWFANGGVYVSLYKGPLIRLGLIQSGPNQTVAVTKLGRPLAEAFARTVSGTALAARGFGRATVNREDLEAFGQKACPCSLSTSRPERNALRDLFFETPTPPGRMLADTLGLILSAIEQCEPFTNKTLETQYRMALYYRQLYDNADQPQPFRVAPSLEGVWAGWRMFQAHDYFSFALETLLTVWLEALDAAPNQRLTVNDFLAEMDAPIFTQTICGRLGIPALSQGLDTLRLSDIIQALPGQPTSGVVTATSSAALDEAVRLDYAVTEQTLVDSIWERYQKGGQRAERCAEALLLLLVVYVRFYQYHLHANRERSWLRYQAASSQTNTDLGLPRFYFWYPPAELASRSVRDWLAQVMVGHIIRQALEIRDERGKKAIWFMDADKAGMSELSPLTQAYQFQYSFENYRTFRNTSKLRNALALLYDVGYVEEQAGHWTMTRDGAERLRQQERR